MKTLIILLTTFFASTSLAADTDILIYLLDHQNTRAIVQEREIASLQLSKTNLDNIWKYEANIVYKRESDVFPMCVINISFQSIENSTELTAPEVSDFCAQL